MNFTKSILIVRLHTQANRKTKRKNIKKIVIETNDKEVTRGDHNK